VWIDRIDESFQKSSWPAIDNVFDGNKDLTCGEPFGEQSVSIDGCGRFNVDVRGVDRLTWNWCGGSGSGGSGGGGGNQ
jgi:hypothetical protein